MSKKIGGLYYEITGDTSGLDKSLDESKEKMEGAAKGADNFKDSMTELNSKLQLAKEGLRYAAEAYDMVITDTVSYAKQVEDLSRLIGATPEESSKMIQAADDMRISYGTLQTAMEAAIRNGFDPSIRGLQDITAQYQAIQDPIERSKFLMETFGRSGADMAPLLELPRQRLDELAASADKVGLVMSGADLQAAKDYALAMDDLEDKVNGAKVKIGNELIPALTWFIEHGSAVEDSIDSMKLKWMDWIPVLGSIRDAILWIQQAGASLGGKDQGGMTWAGGYTGAPQGLDQGGMSWNTPSTRFNTPVNGAANGADFIVPPGFNNDSFPMHVQSGEHVTVTPAGKQQQPDNGALIREIKGLRSDFTKYATMGAQ